MTQALTNRRREDLGQPGPAMRALPNDRWRLFVETFLWETFTNGNKNNFGAQAAAARKAGIRHAQEQADHAGAYRMAIAERRPNGRRDRGGKPQVIASRRPRGGRRGSCWHSQS